MPWKSASLGVREVGKSWSVTGRVSSPTLCVSPGQSEAQRNEYS